MPSEGQGLGQWARLGFSRGQPPPASLVGSALDLSVFTGAGVPVMVRPDWLSLGLPAVAAMLLAAAALAAEARRLSRRGVTRMLRIELRAGGYGAGGIGDPVGP